MLALNRVRRLHPAALSSLLTGIAGQAILLISGVLVARSLGPENRGYLALLLLLPLIITELGAIGLPLGLTYAVARERRAARAVARLVLTPAVLQALILTAVHALVLWRLLAGEPEKVYVAGVVTLASGVSLLGQQYGLAVLQGLESFAAFNILRLLPGCLYVLGVVLTYATGRATLTTIALTWVVASLVAASATVMTARVSIRGGGIDETGLTLSALARFGLRGFVGSTSPLENFRLDQLAVGLFLAPAALGLYVVALAFTNLTRFLSQSLGMVAFPAVAHGSSRATADSATWSFFRLGAAITIIMTAILEASMAWLVPTFFGEAFTDAVDIARILVVGAALLAMRRVLADAVRGGGQPLLGTIAEIASWIAFIPALAVLLPLWGPEGVATAFAISSGLSLLVLVGAVALRARSGRKRRWNAAIPRSEKQ